MKRIAIGGSSANPPHLDHRLLLDDFFTGFGPDFSDLIWIPCGERVDKHFAVCPSCQENPKDFCGECVNHRIAMTEMTVGDLRTSASLPYFSIWYDDVFGKNTSTIAWLEKLATIHPQAEITWVTGSDSVMPREEFDYRNEIQAEWQDGERLWQDRRWNWLVFCRPGYHLRHGQLPPNVQMRELAANQGLSSSEIRYLIRAGRNDWEAMVTTQVAAYIKRHGLYGWKEKRHDG